MRHIEHAPLGIVERRLLRARDIAQMETPTVIEILRLSLSHQHEQKSQHLSP
jgi:hypothetical protein